MSETKMEFLPATHGDGCASNSTSMNGSGKMFKPVRLSLNLPMAVLAIGVLFSEGITQAATPTNTVPIDRHALVTRHNITWNDPARHLPLGNGEFSFGADGTGLQTFAGNSMSHWGWHSFPLPDGWTPDRVPVTGTFQKGRNIGPDDTYPPGTDAIRAWMRDNPHIMNLGRLRLMHSDGRPISQNEISGLNRSLDLWSGVQTSHYQIDGNDVTVETCVHPSLDMVAVSIESRLVERGELEVALDFAYPAMNNGAWVGDFNRTNGQSTVGMRQGDQRVDLVRKVDVVTYYASLMAGEGGTICLPSSAGASQPAHDVWTVSARGSKTLSLVCAYSADPLPRVLPSVAETKTASAVRWVNFWKSGGAIDLSGSTDPRWFELERRIVLSQYLMAAMSDGSWPSSENGLVGIDPWHGRFHMEMVWWHLAHYALWDRWDMLTNALPYQRFIPQAQALAAQLDYKGLKWGKSVGPDGRTAPWIGNQVLLWKQPHPIFFAELDYHLHPTRATLEKWADIVQGTAENMADYPTKDEQTGTYHLAFVMPPSERGTTSDTVFDLAYWRWGLDKAQEWRQRMGLPRVPQWDEVRRNLAPLPVANGLFIHTAEWNDTYTKRAWEHPDPIGVLGMLPPMDGVDPEIAKRTVSTVWKTWDWDRCWGWDFPWIAMAAARTGQPQIAVDALLKNSPKNDYSTDGMCGGWYLPGNGGLLYAVAMMAAGWDGAPNENAPGFPQDGKWVVRWEDLKKAP
jgi:hypothetical protein